MRMCMCSYVYCDAGAVKLTIRSLCPNAKKCENENEAIDEITPI